MSFEYFGDLDGLTEGIGILDGQYKFSSITDDIKVTGKKTEENILKVACKDGNAVIKYKERSHFFRGLGILAQGLEKGEREILVEEVTKFTMNGAMFDVSQGNAVINIPNVKRILRYMAMMGLNMFLLYAEDSYEIKEEPYFGHMRSKYTVCELKEIDEYAYHLGIEVIPCIQTLAHLVDVLKWSPYEDFIDDDDTLMVGDERTYKFAETMIRRAKEPFRTNRIHIGMDEAWRLGQGNYLLKNGYRNKFDLMNEHLERVLEITNQMGLEPMIWSDMYFRAASDTGDYYDMAGVIPQEIIERAPKGVQLIYWDYYHSDKAFYKEWIKRHRQFGQDPVFAGGLWTWTGFTHNYGLTFLHTNAALSSCKEEGIKEVFATIWGDDTTECNIYSNLIGLQLFAEHGFCEELSMEKLKDNFKYVTKIDYDDFELIKYLDEVPGTLKGNPENKNPSKYLMWQDILLGLFDKNIEGLPLQDHYRNLSVKLGFCCEKYSQLKFIFEFAQKVSRVLEIKSQLGLSIRKAYLEKDTEGLKTIVNQVLPGLNNRVTDLWKFHRKQWFHINKAAGMEILDIRYGALIARIDTVSMRLDDYINGRIDSIEELDHERLPFNDEKGLVQCNIYNRMPSASRISITTRY